MAVEPSRSRILVVEDEPSVREVVLAILSDTYDVVAASNGMEALGLLTEDGGFDLLFTDIVMPHLNGFELAREAKRLRPDLQVLYGSGFAESIGLGSMKLHGPVIRKPYRADELHQRVMQVLRLS
jgi:CheY-like chemotaxis protein